MSIFIHFVKFDFGLRNKLSPVSLPHAFGMGGSDVFLHNLLPTPSEIKFSFITIIIMAFIMVIKINWAKRKAESLPKPSNKSGISKPKKGLWVGVDLDDSDLETSSDEEIEVQSAKNKGKGKGKSSASKAISVN